MLKTSVSLPRYVVDDLRRLARIKGMTSYQLSKTGYSFCQVYLILMVSRNGIFDKGEGVLILMPSFVNVHQAKTQLSKLLKRAHEGEEIVLVKAGKPYARLVSLEEAGPRIPGIAKGRVDGACFEPLPESELKVWNQ